ncbi:SIR2 family protein [Desulfatirhabdium butyrativorans]|uniref:SIR2 family protein n=1 Tax=Desulfatirhabdium butyrativorans TaxID=340467 RepID=UPI000404CACB|nr:SIR2 family protein [Desulfatirhabdium butyrativorans]
MSETFRLSDYQIRIGNEDIIERHLHGILSAGPENPENQEKAQKALDELLKEMRVRFGTIIKTDNVSFLLGAGSSLAAGSISLANIPKPLEKVLIDKAKAEQKGKKAPAWIELFYMVASALSRENFSFDIRSELLSTEEKDIPAISVNLEAYLSQLHTWHAGMLDVTDTLKLTGGSELSIVKSDLAHLIKEITGSLTILLNLPKSGLDEPLRSHRKFIKKVLTRPLNLRRANLFTLNYDTLIEQAGDAEGAVLVDGFVGTLRRVFRPESYDIDFYFPAQTTEGRVHRFDRALHLYKLHGSITWHRCEPDWGNPFGLYATFYNQDCCTDDVLIYPSPLKYGQALGMPYSELFRRFGNAIAQPQSALFVIGYGFGDDHVNVLIRQALAIPSFTLVVVDPNPKSDFVAALEKLEDERVWIVKGWGLGTFEGFVAKLLPDLREEEIDAKVMKTFKGLSSPSGRKAEGAEEDNDGK